MSRYFIRVQAPFEQAGAFVTWGVDGEPQFTWEQQEPGSSPSKRPRLRCAMLTAPEETPCC